MNQHTLTHNLPQRFEPPEAQGQQEPPYLTFLNYPDPGMLSPGLLRARGMETLPSPVCQ